MNNNVAPEFETVETFVQFLLDDERSTFMPGEAQKVAEATKRSIADVTRELKEYGFTVNLKIVREVRGIHSNNHDKYSAKNGFVGGCGIGNASRQMVSSFQPK